MVNGCCDARKQGGEKRAQPVHRLTRRFVNGNLVNGTFGEGERAGALGAKEPVFLNFCHAANGGI